MKIVAPEAELKKVLKKSALVSGTVYTNDRWPSSYFLKFSSAIGPGVINLSSGSLIRYDDMADGGWIEVEAEVHIK